ncbi:MAG TPA: RNA 2',3'-cyclic phosphodiesterase [Actinomycetes bacterium]|nr:RNA 2',3'-cyclic phosphodiesterase [Actinomycetes bacterium]
MRVFVAVMVPDAARAALASGVSALRDVNSALAWELPERWHITLSFLGDVDESSLGELTPRLEWAASRTQPFRLRLAGVGRFGNRVLYAKVVADRAALRRLAERTTAAARRAGVELPDERYRPHVTLARSRKGSDLRALVDAGLDLVTPEWQVDEFVVVHSILGPDRRYEILGSHALSS